MVRDPRFLRIDRPSAVTAATRIRDPAFSEIDRPSAVHGLDLVCGRGVSDRRATQAMVASTHASGKARACRYEPWDLHLTNSVTVRVQEYQARDPATHRICMAMAVVPSI